MKIVTERAMRAGEAAACAAGIAELDLMVNAGTAAACAILEYIQEHFPDRIHRVVVVAGKGNNGGDGFVVADVLRRMAQCEVLLYALSKAAGMREPGRTVANEVESTLRPEPAGDEFEPGDLIVDAINGIGLSGNLRGAARQWVEAINASHCPVVALDVPSGIAADSGEGDCVVQAHGTIAMGFFKPCHRSGSCGQLRWVTIGLPEAVADEVPFVGEAITDREAAALFAPLAADLHKNKRGRVGICAGSARYGGAAVLATRGAFAAGIGMVRTVTPEAGVVGHTYPASAILSTTKGRYLAFDNWAEELADLSDVVLVGPGLGQSEETVGLVERILQLDGCAFVLDADALNVLAGHPEWVAKRTLPVVLTPHPGEAQRLLAFEGSSQEHALALARHYQCMVVLKGWRSIIAAPDGRWCMNTTGNGALSTGGTGDVLAGLTAGLLAAYPEDPFLAVATACYLHGRAGESSEYGRALNADDLPEAIRRTAKNLWWWF